MNSSITRWDSLSGLPRMTGDRYARKRVGLSDKCVGPFLKELVKLKRFPSWLLRNGSVWRSRQFLLICWSRYVSRAVKADARSRTADSAQFLCPHHEESQASACCIPRGYLKNPKRTARRIAFPLSASSALRAWAIASTTSVGALK